MAPEQCRMARAALKWSSQDLAKAASITAATVNYFENGKDTYTSTVKNLKNALLDSGRIRFEDDCCVCIKNNKE